MSEFLNYEEIVYLNLKKLNFLLENLSSNLSKDKTENALKEGYNYIKEIENIINKMEKSQKERCGNNNLLMIKDDFSKKKEKFENIQKKYILNKSNQLIDSLSDNNASTNNENNEEHININKKIMMLIIMVKISLMNILKKMIIIQIYHKDIYITIIFYLYVKK